ncbi:Gam-like protein [Aneurinibacillus soli]|uniref:Bacteriophage Mu Gam like protein n=1 Tax=Aneurinibacillus soli TaxID=1500254 RepID=A0A0U5AV26_9BACL|nr:host-nuclease inhibitor Gam family protein [Aneurinibacillus soli]PYE63463.1 Gam-like protein [Aneurinibacillus soli]BAU27605.1 Bacteriophage Mu Gam like protein [Aneurinibacillus soli]
MAVPVERLDDMLAEAMEVQEGWQVTDLKGAMWADERINEAQLKVDEIDVLAEERIESLQRKIDIVNQWKEEAKKPYLDTISFFAGKLMLYLQQTIQEQIEAGKKKITKSLKLPFSKPSFKKKQPEVKRDDEQLLTWLEANHPEFIERKPTVKWGDFKKVLTQTEVDGKLVYVDECGQVVPHVELNERPDEFSLR